VIHSRGGQDLGAALLFVVLGLAGLWFGREYEFGTTANMGPGFVPMMLSGLLVLLGLALGSRALTRGSLPIERVRWRPVLVLTVAMLVFGLLMGTAGFAPAVAFTALVAAAASRETRWGEATLLALALAVVCALVFVVALHQPIAIFGGG
jgi:hypothetical protein